MKLMKTDDYEMFIIYLLKLFIGGHNYLFSHKKCYKYIQKLQQWENRSHWSNRYVVHKP